MQLRFASFVVVNLRRDFHPQDRAHAGRTSVQIVASHDLTLVVARSNLGRYAADARDTSNPEKARTRVAAVRPTLQYVASAFTPW